MKITITAVRRYCVQLNVMIIGQRNGLYTVRKGSREKQTPWVLLRIEVGKTATSDPVMVPVLSGPTAKDLSLQMVGFIQGYKEKEREV